jgi:GNAT superfamily N-acetyltransferase
MAPTDSPSEICALRDGTEVVIRPIGPADAELLKRGFEQLSPRSRYRRFFTAKPSLSAKEVRYLTEVDQVDHVALGAMRHQADGREEGLGIARYIRDAVDREVAEPALAVVDAVQGLGLGALLLDRLASAAIARGVRSFQCSVLAENESMKQLFQELSPGVTVTGTGFGLVELLVPLPPDIRQSPLHQLLSQAASEAIEVRLGPRHRALLDDG